MGTVNHLTVARQIWVDVDEGIADFVVALNAITGIRTHASCQGTIGEGGPKPYPAFVTISWETNEALAQVREIAEIAEVYDDNTGRQWGHAHPHENWQNVRE